MMGWGRRRTGESNGEIGRAAMLGCLVAALLAGSVAVVAAATRLEIGPKVGDILVFRQGARAPSDWEFTVSASARPTPTCTLKPDVMISGGGSLVVEERLDKPRAYRVHWAGPRTSDGSGDCGSTADLVVSGPDLQLLTNVVGGPGVERGWFANF